MPPQLRAASSRDGHESSTQLIWASAIPDGGTQRADETARSFSRILILEKRYQHRAGGVSDRRQNGRRQSRLCSVHDELRHLFLLRQRADISL